MAKTARSQKEKSKANGGKNNGKAHKKLKFEWQKKFIRELQKTGNITKSCRRANVSRKWAYEVKGNDPEFAERWRDALEEAIDDLEEEANNRATDGDHKGDGLLKFMLMAHRPEKYGRKIEHTGAEGKPLFDMTGLVKLLQQAEKEIQDE